MQLRTWKPGLVGLIYIPSRSSNAADKNRPYYAADVDAEGKLRVRKGLMIWHEARASVLQLAHGRGKLPSEPLKVGVSKTIGYMAISI
jgi:hypothetical protein